MGVLYKKKHFIHQFRLLFLWIKYSEEMHKSENITSMICFFPEILKLSILFPMLRISFSPFLTGFEELFVWKKFWKSGKFEKSFDLRNCVEKLLVRDLFFLSPPIELLKILAENFSWLKRKTNLGKKTNVPQSWVIFDLTGLFSNSLESLNESSMLCKSSTFWKHCRPMTMLSSWRHRQAEIRTRREKALTVGRILVIVCVGQLWTT